MALNDLTGQNIQDTYQKVVQTDGTNLADGTGSLLPISFDGNDVIISGSLTANEYIVSSSVTNIIIATLSGSTTFGDSADDTHTFTGHITASGNISSSATSTGSFGLLRASNIGGNSPLIISDVTEINFNNADLRGNTIFHDDVNIYDESQFLDAADNPFFGSNDLIGANGLVTFGGGGTNTKLLGLTVQLAGNVTASGNISASGTGSFSDGRFTGKVGIGTTTPAQKLVVNVDGVGDVEFVTTTNGQYGLRSSMDMKFGDFYFFNSGGGHIRLFNGVSALRVNSGGIAINEGGEDRDFRVESDTNTHALFLEGSSGNLGIGTSSPATTLDINGAITARNNLDFHFQSYPRIIMGTGGILFRDNDDGGTRMSIADNGDVYILGNVGIGITTPTEKLTVEGNISASGTITANSFVGSFTGAVTGDATGLTGTPNITVGNITATGTVTAQEFHTEFISASIIYQSGSTKFGDTSDDIHQFSGSLRVTGSGDHYFTDGNVGIGTDSPSEKLHVKGALKINSEVSSNNIIINGGDGSNLAVITSRGNGLTLATGTDFGYTHIKLLPGGTGNVGIGTTTPTEKLTVEGNISASGYISTLSHITASGNISSSGDIMGVTGSFNYVKTDKLQVGTAGGTDILSIDGGDLQLENNKQITWADIGDGNTGRVYIRGNEDSDFLQFTVDNSNTHTMRYNTTGLGIGNLSPTEKLTVEGNISASGTITANAFVGGVTGDATGLTGTPDITVGTITAREFHTEFVSASILYESGSTKFGDTSDDIHQFSGSLRVTGSGDHYFLGGDVGIGTTSPGYKLDIWSDDAAFNFGTNDGNNAAYMKIQSGRGIIGIDDGSGTNSGKNNALFFKSAGSRDIVFNTNASTTPSVTILRDGNVGIGTTSPSNKLDVQDTSATYVARFRGASATYVQSGESTLSGESGFLAKNSTGALYINVKSAVANLTGTSGANTMTFGVGGAEKMRITLDGNVGIGTSSPSAKLDVAGNVYVGINDNTAGQLRLYGDGASSNQGGRLILYSAADHDGTYNYFDLDVYQDDLRIQDASGNGITIQGGGNVGIGTTSPSAKLEVVSGTIRVLNDAADSVGLSLKSPHTTGVNVTFDFEVGDTGLGLHSKNLVIRGSSGASDIAFSPSTSYPGLLMLDGSSGNVGIGTTSPASKLHVAGTFQVGVDDTGHDVKFFGATSGRYLHWDESADSLIFTDSTSAQFGTGGDLVIEHNGSTSLITNYNGDLKIVNNANDKDIIFQSDDGSGGVANYFVVDGSAEQTRFYKPTRHTDGIKANFGNADDLQIYHDGSNSYISDTGTGGLFIKGSTFVRLRSYLNEDYFTATEGGSVDLFYNNAKKFETTATGAAITGDLTVTGILTAQEFHTEFISASIIFSSGSTQFGNSADDIHTFSGSINVKDGSITGSRMLLTGSGEPILDIRQSTYGGSDGPPLQIFDGYYAYSIGLSDAPSYDPNSNSFRITKSSSRVLFFNNKSNGFSFDKKVQIGEHKQADEALTVTGNISASGNLIVQHITASGNISASGTIIADNIVVGGTSVDGSGLTVNNRFVVEATDGSDWFTVGKAGSGIIDFNGQGGITRAGGVDLGARFNIQSISDSIPTLAIRGKDGSSDLVRVSSYNATTGDYLNIKNDGKVGIGTASPEAKLHIEEASAGSFVFDGSADTLIVESNANGGITIATAAANTGRLIFASPNDATGAEIKYSDATSLMTVGTTTPGDSLVFQSANGTEAMRIDSSQNVGIGTTSPTEKLQVTGNISSSGTITGDTITGNIVSSVGGFGNYRTISSDQTIPADFNAVLYVSTHNPSITISAGVNYTVSAGADVAITNMNNI